ncbi:MAG: glycosyltransferase [Fibrobacterales bacterium]
MIQYSIVIVTYNCQNEIIHCLESIRQHYTNAGVQIIVVDNDSTDTTAEVLQRETGIELLLNKSNRGFAEACNQGAARAEGEFVLFLNPDTQLTCGSLEALAEPLRQSKQVGAVGPLSNFAAGWQNLRYVYNQQTMGDANDALQKEIVAVELSKTLKGQAKEVKLLIGFCVMLRTQLFNDIGGMDSALILGMDDLDLSWRLSLMGKKLIAVYDAFVYHKGQVSFNATPSERVEHMKEESRKVFSKKLIDHYGTKVKVPSSWDLWEIDWFELEEEIESEIAIQIGDPQDLEKERSMSIAYCIMTKESTTSRKSIEQSIDALFELGVSPDDIVVANSSGLVMTQSFISKDVFEWNISSEAPFAEVLKRARRWFVSDAILFLVGGVAIPHLQFSALAKRATLGTALSGRLLDINAGTVIEPEPSRLIFEESISQIDLNYFLIPESVQESCTIENYPDLVLHVTHSIDSELEAPKMGDDSLPQKVGETTINIPTGLPAQVEALVKEYRSVCFYGKGQFLDLTGKEMNPVNAKLIIYRLSISDIRLLSVLLKRNQGEAFQCAAFIFDNSMFQSREQELFTQKGVQPIDVIREAQLAGLTINSIDPYECNPIDIDEAYASVRSKVEGFNREETLYATAQKIMITTTPCSRGYSLENKVSIIMLALNKLEYTKQCIESIQKYTTQQYELVLVNNGSTDGTKEYFDSITGAVVVHNSENRGVAAGWNQGIDRATGDYLLIFNNDTIVGPGSIENLVRAAENHPNAGIVAPRSNAIAGPQMVEGFRYDSVAAIPSYIEQYQNANECAAWEFTRIKGFCMLMAKETVSEIGYFDEQFGFGNFEDDDYSCRVLYSGKKLLVADDSFIFHYGSVSFGQADCDWNELMIKNKKLFDEKWKEGRATLSQNAFQLPGVTLPIVPTENTLHDSNEVQHHHDPAWIALRGGNYDEANRLFLDKLAQNDRDSEVYFGLGLTAIERNHPMDGYTFFCRGLEFDPDNSAIASAITKFLREHSAAQDMLNVLQVLSRKYPQQRAFTDLLAELQTNESDVLDGSWVEKIEALIEAHEFVKATALLDQKRALGESGFELYNLYGVQAYYRGIYDDAFNYFDKALSYNPTDEDTLLNLYDAGLRLKLWGRLIEILEYGLAMKPELDTVRRCYEEIKSLKEESVDPQNLIFYREMNIGVETLIREGMLEKAESTVDEVLEKEPHNYRALNNKGLILWYQGDKDGAWNYFKESLEINIWYTDAVMNMYDCSLLIQKEVEFEQYLDKALAVAPANRDLLSVKQELQSGKRPSRMAVYFDTVENPLQQKVASAKKLVESQEYEAAVMLFTEVLEQEPDNIDCYNGLGIIAYYWGNYQDSFKLISRAVELKPLDQDSLLNLWDAALKIGREVEVREVLQTAVTLDPSLQQVAETIG